MALKIKTFFFEKRLAFFLSLALVACVGLLPLSSDAPCLAVLPLCRGHRPCCVCAALHLQRQPPLPFTQQHVICSVFHGQDVVTVTAIRCSVSSAFLLSNKLPEEGGRRWRLPVTSLPPSSKAADIGLLLPMWELTWMSHLLFPVSLISASGADSLISAPSDMGGEHSEFPISSSPTQGHCCHSCSWRKVRGWWGHHRLPTSVGFSMVYLVMADVTPVCYSTKVGKCYPGPIAVSGLDLMAIVLVHVVPKEGKQWGMTIMYCLPKWGPC